MSKLDWSIFKLVKKDTNVNENDKLSNITLTIQIKVTEPQLEVRKDLDLNKHVKLSNIILKI